MIYAERVNKRLEEWRTERAKLPQPYQMKAKPLTITKKPDYDWRPKEPVYVKRRLKIISNYE